MRKIWAALALTFAYAITLAQAEPQNYKTTVSKLVRLYNQNKADSIFAMFSPQIKAATTAQKNKQTFTSLQSQLGDLKHTTFLKIADNVATYKADFQKATLAMKVNLNNANQLAGLLFDNYQSDATPASIPAKTLAPDPSVTESPVVIKGLEGQLAGTLSLPKSGAADKMSVVLIVPGSGPMDRNGNSARLNLQTNSYKLLADELGKNGIACLRYDKRGVGESKSTTTESQMRFEDNIEDAIQFINYLHDDQRFSKIIVLGHSEGSLVGMMAAHDEPVNAFISVAGAGQPAEKIILEQMKSQPDYIASGVKTVLDSLRKGKVYDKVDASLYFIVRPSVQPYLMSWCRYDPVRELHKLRIPILIVQGNTDLQVKVDDAEKLKKAKSEAVLDVIPDMNHIMKDAPAEKDKNLATYTNPDLPLKPEFVTAVVDFIKKVK